MNTQTDYLTMGLALMKACYLEYSNKTPDFSKLEIFYQEELEEIVETKCGKEFAILLKHLIKNFPMGNFLRM